VESLKETVLKELIRYLAGKAWTGVKMNMKVEDFEEIFIVLLVSSEGV